MIKLRIKRLYIELEATHPDNRHRQYSGVQIFETKTKRFGWFTFRLFDSRETITSSDLALPKDSSDYVFVELKPVKLLGLNTSRN